ncbi:MAG: CDP-diacylglycerol--serine O-phosphatidyltransferase [Paracoccaceae bacterium]|jgi:CDP-diacylglycerol--serine O-phosphatidyltransferase
MSTGPQKRKPLSMRQLLPNLITLFVISAGLTAIRLGFEGKFGLALLLVLLAAVLDAADGRIARALDSISDLGAELDSLADFLNFGIAPGLLVYFAVFAGTENTSLGWLAVLALSVCCALRLARFNIAMDIPEEKTWKSSFFVGVPAPALGALALLPMFFQMLGHDTVSQYPVVIFCYLVCIALMAVSRIPTFSIKYLQIPQDKILYVMIFGAGFAVSMVVYTWQTIIVGDILYLLSIPVSAWIFTRQERNETSSTID